MSKQITLGLQIDQLVTGYSKLLAAGISDWCRKYAANLVMFTSTIHRTPLGREHQYAAIFNHIKQGTIDALVLASSSQLTHQTFKEYNEYIRRFTGIPLVSTGIRIDGIPSVLVDNRNGILEAVRHLNREHGIRRIAFLRGPQHHIEANLRFAAYQEAVREANLDDDQNLYLQGDFSRWGARSTINDYLEQKGRIDFQALISANDEMAIGAAEFLHEQGYSIPGDLAVIGFDNILISQFSVPPITTIEQPIFELGRTAVGFAAKLVRGESVPKSIVLPTRLIVRASCGCMPKAVCDFSEISFTPGRSSHPFSKKALIEHCIARLTGEEFAVREETITDTLDSLIKFSGTDRFLNFFQETLYSEISDRIDISVWQNLLTILQEGLVEKLQIEDEVTDLLVTFQKARILLSDLLRLEQGKGWNELLDQLGRLRNVMDGLISVASIEELMANLTGTLTYLDIKTCFIAGYPYGVRNRIGKDSMIPDRAEVMLAFVDGERLDLSNGERFFSPGQILIPRSYLPADRRYIFIAMSIYFRGEQIGYIVFEPGNRDYSIYETFCTQLGNVLRASLLFSARQEAEEALSVTLSRWQTTFDAVTDSIMILDKNHRVLEFNRATRQMSNKSNEMIVGKHCWEIFHETTKPIADCPLIKMIKSRQRESLELPLGNRWMVEVVDPIFDDSGDIAGAVHIVRDITARRHAEAELVKLSTAIEQSPTLVVITDLKGAIEYVNPKFTETTGYTYEEVIGKNARILRSEKAATKVHREMWRTIIDGHEWHGEFLNQKKDGTEYWERTAISPIRDTRGNITHYLAVIEDITAQKALENQFRQAQKMESVGRLAGGVAHDFNNMLTVIIGHTNAALTKVVPDSRLQYHLQEILKAAQRSSDLTSQLLAFARKQTISPVVMDLNETVAGMLSIIRRLIGEDIELKWHPNQEIWPVKIDPAQVGQILINLSINARDAIAGVGILTIETSNTVLDEEYCKTHAGFVPGGFVSLAVSDNGIGMDSSILEHIFEPFFTTKELGKGTGLGLSTVYGIVKQNNGFINVYSEQRKGTTFKIYLPRVLSEIEKKAEVVENKPARGNETIILVEDEESILTLGETILHEHGYTVFSARTPIDALEITRKRKGPIHLLITDVIMPGMNGKELMEQMLVLRPGLKTLFMSGYTANLIVHHGVLDEGFQFLQKPFSIKTFAEKVREVLDN